MVYKIVEDAEKVIKLLNEVLEYPNTLETNNTGLGITAILQVREGVEADLRMYKQYYEEGIGFKNWEDEDDVE